MQHELRDKLVDNSERENTWAEYVGTVPYELYPVQQEAILAWFTTEHGVLVCAPTGTGKTLIAEGAVFEALKTGKKLYYTTPLIALTDQKFEELRSSAERWGFSANDIGLVTGNRRVNPDAPILVVVAEILLNRLLHAESFDFQDVSGVVMDEFHSFNDPERGIVWELTLSLLPTHVRMLLLSATVGNAYEFTSWLRIKHQRNLELVQGTHRRVPLSYHWIPDLFLEDQIEFMARGDETIRKTPALIFCFNRDECWQVGELLKGRKLIDDAKQKLITKRLEEYDLSQGAGPTLKQLLIRGVGVHHAGVLPKYRRIVEELFTEKLLAVTVCTETLAAGINLPARSVVIPSLLKGPPQKKKLIDPSSAHQMFGRAGRPQFDTEGHVFSLPHEDDVKYLRWKEKYDQIPEDTKDPKLMQAKKALKKKMPRRRENQQYWSEAQFRQLQEAPPGKLGSRGEMPWRLLAYMLQISPNVDPLRQFVTKRLLPPNRVEPAIQDLHTMLVTLWRAGYVELDPKPQLVNPDEDRLAATETFDLKNYRPEKAFPTEAIEKLFRIRSINPLYGMFLLNQLGIADRAERIQAFESVLELPNSIGPSVRVPRREELPPGPLQNNRLDQQLLQLGIVSAEQLGMELPEDENAEEENESGWYDEPPVRILNLAEKLRLLFQFEFPGVHDIRVNSVWAVGEALAYGTDFNKYITSNRLHKQEGVLFRHLLRMILLLEEFADLAPPEVDSQDWANDLYDIADQLADMCRRVDPTSTDEMLSQAKLAKEEGDWRRF